MHIEDYNKMNDNNELVKIDIYDMMKKGLKVNEKRSEQFMVEIGKELISKIKLLDEECYILNPDRVKWNLLDMITKDKLSACYQLKSHYNSQFDMIRVMLNKSNDIVVSGTARRLKDKGLNDKFFITIK